MSDSMWAGIVLGYAAISVIFGYLCRALAEHKGYSGYFVMGFLLWVVGLIYVVGLPLHYDEQQLRDRALLDAIREIRDEIRGSFPATEAETNAKPVDGHTDAPIKPIVSESEPDAGGAVVPLRTNTNGFIRCPVCATTQRKDRLLCMQCGAKFAK